MFIFGLFLMSVSIIGLVAIAFMHARYPDMLEGLLPPLQEAAAQAKQADLQKAHNTPPTSSAPEVALEQFTVNSMHHAATEPAPQSE